MFSEKWCLSSKLHDCCFCSSVSGLNFDGCWLKWVHFVSFKMFKSGQICFCFTHLKAKVLSGSGGFAPWLGTLPLDLARGKTPHFRYGLGLHAPQEPTLLPWSLGRWLWCGLWTTQWLCCYVIIVGWTAIVSAGVRPMRWCQVNRSRLDEYTSLRWHWTVMTDSSSLISSYQYD